MIPHHEWRNLYDRNVTETDVATAIRRLLAEGAYLADVAMVRTADRDVKEPLRSLETFFEVLHEVVFDALERVSDEDFQAIRPSLERMADEG